MNFDFSRVEKNSKPHSFDLGDITISSDDLTISSTAEERYRMMIYVTISDMIDIIKKVIKTNKSSKFSGTDSSFTVEVKTKNGKLFFSRKNIEVVASTQVALNAIKNGIEDFFHDGNSLTVEDACYSDISASMKTLKSLISEVESSRRI